MNTKQITKLLVMTYNFQNIHVIYVQALWWLFFSKYNELNVGPLIYKDYPSIFLTFNLDGISDDIEIK